MSAAAKLLCTGGGILIGVGLAWMEAVSHAEVKAKNKYEELLGIHKRALERAHEEYLRNHVEEPAESESDLSVLTKELKVGGEMTVTSDGQAPPDYIKTAALYADPGTFAGHQVVESISIIEAEEFEEEDGRDKEQVTIFMGGDEAIFVMDGEQLENWEDLLGEHILVEFYKAFPPEFDGDRVLFLRNHVRDTDYEVAQVMQP